MSTTTKRRLRRIGLLPTSFKIVKELVLERNDKGIEIEVTKEKSIPVRHREQLSLEELTGRATEVKKLMRARNLAFRSNKKSGRKTKPEPIMASASKASPSSKKGK